MLSLGRRNYDDMFRKAVPEYEQSEAELKPLMPENVLGKRSTTVSARTISFDLRRVEDSRATAKAEAQLTPKNHW